MSDKPIIQELEDGCIIRDDNGTFSELVDGQWVEPTSDFSIDDFIKGKTPSNL